MKQLLLVVVIHVLIFHQYLKDKNESLATPSKRKIVKAITPSPAQVSLPTAIINTSSLYFHQPNVLPHPVAIDIIPDRYWITGNMIRR
jgi:hypothetical protein